MLTFSLASTQRLDQNSARPCISATVEPTFTTAVSRSNGRLSIPTAIQLCITVVPRSDGRSNLEYADVCRTLRHVIADTEIDYIISVTNRSKLKQSSSTGFLSTTDESHQSIDA